MTMYKPEDFRSIGWLQKANGEIKLTPVLKNHLFPMIVVVSKHEFDLLQGDKEKMLILACKYLNTRN